MIKVEEKDPHKSECDSCGSPEELKTIKIGRDPEHTSSTTLCGNCRSKLVKGVTYADKKRN